MSLNQSGSLKVETNYLTNYFFRGVNNQTGAEGVPRIIQRNDRSLDFSSIADLEFDGDGLIPFSVDFSYPEFNRVETITDLRTYPFPNNGQWQNSILQFRGSSLIGLASNLPDTNTERVDAILLFLLNTLTLTENLLSVLSESGQAGVGNVDRVLERIRPLAERIANIEQEIQNLQTLLVFVDLFISQMKSMISVAGIQMENEPVFQNNLRYYQLFTEAIERLESVFGALNRASASTTTSARRTLADQYARLMSTAPNTDADSILSQASVQFSNQYNGTTDQATRLQLIEQYAINPFADTLLAYIGELERQLVELENRGASESVIEAKMDEITFIRNGYAIAQLSAFLFNTPALLESVRDSPREVIPTLFNVSKLVFSEVVNVGNAANLGYVGLAEAIGSDGSSQAQELVASANAYLAAFRASVAAGNKTIPLIWDIVFAPNDISVGVLDGNLNTFGIAEPRVTIRVNDGENRTFSGSQTNNLIHIAADPNDTLLVSAGLVRPLLLDEGRAPWLLNFYVCTKHTL